MLVHIWNSQSCLECLYIFGPLSPIWNACSYLELSVLLGMLSHVSTLVVDEDVISCCLFSHRCGARKDTNNLRVGQ